MMEDSEDDWDADEFDPEAGFATKENDEEEEDLAVKALREEEKKRKEEEEKKRIAAENATAVAAKSKQERIEEKKAERRAKEMQKTKENEAAEEELTNAEVVELQKLQDREAAKSLFGESDDGMGSGIDAMCPQAAEDFEAFQEALAKKITSFDNSPFYTTFLEDLVRTVCAPLDVGDLRKISNTLSTMATEKQKMKNPKKTKKPKATLGGKAVNKPEGGVFDDYGVDAKGNYVDYGGDDIDFM